MNNFSIQILSTCNFTVNKIADGLGIEKVIPITITPENNGGSLTSPFFYKNPQYVVTAVPANVANIQPIVRISYEGPIDSSVLVFITNPNHKSRILNLTSDIRVNKGGDSLVYRDQFICVETQPLINTPYTVIFTSYDESIHGDYKATFNSNVPLDIEEIRPEGYGLTQYYIEV